MIEESEYKYPLQHGGKVICQECGKAFGRIVPSHLLIHGLTYAEYFFKYPKSPKTPEAYTSATHTFNDSVLFKETQGNARDRGDEPQDFDMSKVKEKEEEVIEKSVIDFKGVNKHKVEILKFLHKQFDNLENNYTITKKDIQDRIVYEYITDMADPVSKIIFDFPNTFWHNTDISIDPNKNYKLEKDNWEIITFTKKPISIDIIKKHFDGSISDI
jgi:hypothetical protein